MENQAIIAGKYKKIIAAFKKRYDVQNGHAIAYRPGQALTGPYKMENKPKGIGDALNTTGWCVTASQAFLYDKIFQLFLVKRKAFAKLISIDIKEQYWGYTYSGNQNKWHTAILVRDNDMHIVIDLTCGQFGNKFAGGKDIWDFKTWEKTFRASNCKHKIFDFDNKTLISHLPTQHKSINELKLDEIDVANNLKDISTYQDSERQFLADFFINKIYALNKKLTIKDINKMDYKYLDKVNSLIKHLPFCEKQEKQYTVFKFESENALKEWLRNFITSGYITPQFFLTSNSVQEYCKKYGINYDRLNKDNIKTDSYYLIFEFDNIKTFEIDFLGCIKSLIPYGISLFINPDTDIYNSSKADTKSMGQKSNTIYVKATN